MEEQDNIISKYSSGVNIIIRLDGLWKDAHNHVRQGKFYLWNLDLDCIWSELARDLFKDSDDKKYKEKKNTLDEYDNEISKLGGFYDKKPDGFAPITPEIESNRSKVYKILLEKQLFLARLENEIGKGTTFDTGEDDDFD